MADVISKGEVTSLTTQEQQVQENYYGSIGIITELQNSISNKNKEIVEKQKELDGYRAQLVTAQNAINNMASGVILTAGSYPWTATRYRGSSARDICVVIAEGMPSFGNINFSNVETVRQTITNVRNDAVSGKDLANSKPFFAWPDIKSPSLGNGSQQPFGQYFDFTGVAALPEGRNVANRFFDNTIGYCDNLANLINSAVKNIQNAKSQGESALAPIQNSINNAVSDLSALNDQLSKRRIELTDRVAEYDAAMEEAREVAAKQADATVKRTLASDTDYQKALLVTQASQIELAQKADLEKAKNLAEIDAKAKTDALKIQADIEKAKIESAALASAKLASAPAPEESITKKSWFIPVVVGGAVVVLFGLFFALRK